MDKVLHASKAGFPCLRNLFYSVNNFEMDSSPQTQSVPDSAVVDQLRKDGWNVDYNPTMEVSIPVRGGSIIGHPKCIISSNDLQNVLIDIKTMDEHAFKQWRLEGSKTQYVTQLHIYAMGLINAGRKVEHLGILGVNSVLGVNENNSHMDIFRFNRIYASKIIREAEKVFALKDVPDENCPAEAGACNDCNFAHLCGPNAIIIAAMKELQHARELSKTAKNLAAHAKGALNEYVRAKGLSQIQGGGLTVSISEKASSRFDMAAFKEKYPELVSKYTKTRTSTCYRVDEDETECD